MSSGPTKRQEGKRGTQGHHDVHMLKNGNILFHETWQDVKEINLKKKIVWKYDCATANGNRGKGVNVHAFSRLPMVIPRLWRVVLAE